MEDYYETLNNRQVIALPTTLTDPCQLAVVKLPHPLTTSSCEKYIPVFPSLVDYVRKDAKVPFISCVCLAVRHTMKITAVVMTAV
jgi:hypothetical protein